MKNFTSYLIISIFLGSTFIFNNCQNPGVDKKKLIVFHAGSLSRPFKEIKKNFEKKNPGTEIILEAAGSRECARKITELKKPCDIMASSDYTVIRDLLIPDYTAWYIDFAANEMCIAYTEKSRLQKNINQDNWYDILWNDSVIYGRSDPNLDPCGYRTIVMFELAATCVHQPKLKNMLLQKDREYIRPKEVDLLSLLEAGAIDYIVIYRSVAVQHQLDYIVLPDSINLGNPGLSNFYATASVEISGKNPDEVITKHGEPMVYAFTIPVNAPNKSLALKFSEFLLNPGDGGRIMKNNGQPAFFRIDPEYMKRVPKQLLSIYQNQHQ